VDAFALKKGKERVGLVADLDALSPSLFTLWLDPSRRCLNSSGVQCKEGDSVVTLQGRAEAGFAPTFTASGAPTWHAGGKFPYITFDGTDDYLRTAVVDFCANAQGSLFLLGRFAGSATRTVIGTADEAVTTTVWAILDAGATPQIDVRFDNNQATDDRLTFAEAKVAQRGAPLLLHLRGDGTGVVGKVWGITRPTNAVTGADGGDKMWGGVAGRDSFTIGALVTTSAGSFCNFDLFELMILDSATNDSAAIAAIYAYFRDKYRYRTVAHLGDSWAADTGYGSELRTALAPHFFLVADHGVGSETLAQIGARWDSDVSGKGFDCLVLEGAINDLKAASAGANETLFVEFKRIVDAAISQGMAVVGCTCGPFGNNSGWSATREAETQKYNEKVRNYAAQKGFVLCDLYAHAVNPDPSIRSGDLSGTGQNAAFRPAWELTGGLHYNAGGDLFAAALVARRIFRALNYTP